MSDQLSKVDPNLAHVLQGLHDVLYSGDWSLPDDTQQQLEGIYEDRKNRIESATTPAEVDHFAASWRGDWNSTMRGYAEEYARRANATLARQLAEAKAENAIATSVHEHERLNLMSQLAEATRRLGEVEDHAKEVHDSLALPGEHLTRAAVLARIVTLVERAREAG